MVDPINMTQYDLSPERLEETFLFCIGVAGKPALTTARLLEDLLRTAHARRSKTPWMNPFQALKKYKTVESMIDLLKASRFGCFTLKGRGFHFIVNSGLDLRTCTAEQLYECPGVSMKTAKFFVMHTRRNQEIACLDTHVLKWFRDLGYEDVPKGSPQNPKVYRKWEDIFLAEAKKRNKVAADLDLEIWNHYAGNKISTEAPCGTR
jgi:hypothetical protein